jgi:hypothetical protein
MIVGMDNRDHPNQPALELARDAGLVGADGRTLRRAYESGEKNRLLRGVYVPSQLWDTASHDARYLMRIRAVALTRQSRPVLSHLSAARVWGLPILGPWPREVHLMLAGSGTTRGSKNGVVWHQGPLSDGDVVEIDGLLVTSRLRTLVDLARTTRFISAVVSLDAGLHSPFLLPSGVRDKDIAKEELVEAVQRLGSVRGCRAAARASEFADGKSGSAGESVSRVNIHVCGFPAPLLQVSYARPGGGEDVADFTWEAKHHVRNLPLLGEFDGKVKYTRQEYMQGRSIEEVVWDEKVRQDRLCAPGRGMVRWLWDVALSPVLLRARLFEAGLRPER